MNRSDKGIIQTEEALRLNLAGQFKVCTSSLRVDPLLQKKKVFWNNGSTQRLTYTAKLVNREKRYTSCNPPLKNIVQLTIELLKDM